MKGNQKTVSTESQDEMIGVLTAISIVTKRLAARLSSQQEPSKHITKGGNGNEQNQATARRGV